MKRQLNAPNFSMDVATILTILIIFIDYCEVVIDVKNKCIDLLNDLIYRHPWCCASMLRQSQREGLNYTFNEWMVN